MDQEDEVTCPICLSHLVCARITKCGHTFCLPCILHHVHSSPVSADKECKCPCCGISLLVEDLRTVVTERIVEPKARNRIKLRKLHRQKSCASPYLPQPDAPKHGNPHFAPCQTDADALFSRFNYVDPDIYRAILAENQLELEQGLRANGSSGSEGTFLSMALGYVMNLEKQASSEYEEELALLDRFASVGSGMYQQQSSALVFSPSEATTSSGSGESSWDVEASHDATDSGSANQSKVYASPRARGDSISSHGSSGRASAKSTDRSSAQPPIPPGSMYLDEKDAVHVYQAEDGQLVFMNGFNMTCLLSDFSKTQTGAQGYCRPPLPDTIEATILEVEKLQLIPDMRKRMPFLGHIPLYTDIVFIELDLHHVLSQATKKKFEAEIAKRRKRRQSKLQAEKRADRQARHEEAQRINERKQRLQVVDPQDEFFQVAASPPPQLSGDDFGPTLSTATSSHSRPADPTVPSSASSTPSFSEACQRANAALISSSQEAFPALTKAPENSPSLQRPNQVPGPNRHTAERPAARYGGRASVPRASDRSPSLPQGAPSGGKKKGKKQKEVLFRTGGQRGSVF